MRRFLYRSDIKLRHLEFDFHAGRIGSDRFECNVVRMNEFEEFVLSRYFTA